MIYMRPLSTSLLRAYPLLDDAHRNNSEREMVMLEELFRRLRGHWYAMVLLVVVVVWVAIVHRGARGGETVKQPNSYHDRTTRRLRAFHGPPLHLRLIHPHNSSTGLF